MKHVVMTIAAGLMGGLGAYSMWAGGPLWPVFLAFLVGYLTCLVHQYFDRRKEVKEVDKVLLQAQRDFALSQKLEETAQWLERMEMEEEGEEHRKEAFSLLEKTGNAVIQVLNRRKGGPS